MRRIFSVFIVVLLACCSASGEIKYIEIDNTNNLPTVWIKNIDDFDAMIKNQSVSTVFLWAGTNIVSKDVSTTAIIKAGDMYYAYNLDGYKTIADYKAGKSANFKSAEDYMKAKDLGISESDFYYYYARNTFEKVEDASDAYKNGFVDLSQIDNRNYREKRGDKLSGLAKGAASILRSDYDERLNKADSQIYYDAKGLGYNNFADYDEYLYYAAKGFKDKNEYLLAKSKGFERAELFNQAMEAGFTDKSEYGEAKTLGVKNKADLEKYKKISTAIDKLITDKKLNKDDAILYYLIQQVPKGEYAVSALSKTLRENFEQDRSQNSRELNSALNRYFSNNNPMSYEGVQYLIERRLESFLRGIDTANLGLPNKGIDISQLGSYNKKTEIFKKK